MGIALAFSSMEASAQNFGNRVDVCNEGDVDLQFLHFSTNSSLLGGDKGKIAGWWTIKPGDCEDINPVGPIGLVVVCSGQWSSQGLIEFSCSDLTEREPGGFRAELDFVDWAPWADTLVDQSPKSGDWFCPFMLQTNPFNRQTKKGNKKLSIVSSFGHCDWFFYHMDGMYRGCQYCAD